MIKRILCDFFHSTRNSLLDMEELMMYDVASIIVQFIAVEHLTRHLVKYII